MLFSMMNTQNQVVRFVITTWKLKLLVLGLEFHIQNEGDGDLK